MGSGRREYCDMEKAERRLAGLVLQDLRLSRAGKNNAATMFVPAGSITHGGDSLRVIHHVWVGSKAVWDEIGDSGAQRSEGFRG